MQKGIFCLAVAFAFVFLPFIAEALPPVMQDDPGVDTCLGPEDPFCPQDGSGGSGGGGGGTCYRCATKASEFNTVAASCCSVCWIKALAGFTIGSTRGTSCEVKGTTQLYCDISGSCGSGLVTGVIDTDTESLISGYFAPLEGSSDS